MTPLDEAAQSEVITARAAAGMCDPADMAATMDEAREAIAQMNGEVKMMHFDGACPFLMCLETRPHDHPICPECGAVRHGNIGCKTCRKARAAADFSAANDAALSVAADQYDDWLEWRWTCGIGKF